jgi:hypothetical protein
MILKTKIQELERSELLKLNRCLKQACHEIVGKNRSVSIRTSSKKGYLFEDMEVQGHFSYSGNKIEIFRGSIGNIDKYVKVFIHEWTHSCQKGLGKKYHKMNSIFGYFENPFEVEARESEVIFRSRVWKRAKELMK